MQDPTNEEMESFLAPHADDSFDIAESIYWFASDHHGGQWSNLYSVLSCSDYNPGPCTRGPGESAQHLYDLLVGHFMKPDSVLKQFSVTYEIVTEESAADGEAEERGFVHHWCTLRDAIDAIGGTAQEADSYPCDGSARWFTNSEYNKDTAAYFATGAESRSLHIPENVTPASRNRIARLLGVRVGR